MVEVEQIQHGQSKQFYRVTFEFDTKKAAMRKDNEPFLRIFFQVEAEALAFLKHA